MTFGDFEKHVMPNGQHCFYRDSDHSYWTEIRKKGEGYTAVRESRLFSPSTIAKYADPNPDMLMGWAAKKTCEGVALLGPGLDIASGAELHDLLSRKKLTWRHLRDQAGDTGTYVHDAFERSARGEPVAWAKYPKEVEPYLAAIDRFMADHPDFETAQQEQVVYSRDNRYAGRFDWRGQFERGTLDLLDVKTSRYLSLSYHYQLSLYELAARECGVGYTDRQQILQLSEDGTYTLVPVVTTLSDAADCLRMFHSAKKAEKAVRGQHRASEALLKEAA